MSDAAGGGGTLRVALAGAGMISLYHLRAWATLPGAGVVAVMDPDMDRARERAAAFGVARTYGNAEAMLDAERPDALDVASPRETHAGLVRAAAARGIPVLCQKPLAPRLAEAEALAAEVAGRTRLMVHENWRFRPYYRALKGWLDAGRLGRVTSLTLTYRGSGFLAGADGTVPSLVRQPFMATEPRLMIAESLIHHLDVARWLAGPLRVVTARRQRLVEACVGETAATILLETADGVPVVVEGNGAVPGWPARQRDDLVLTGTRATATFDGATLRLLGPEPEAHAFDHDAAYQSCFDACVAHFAAALRDGTPFETGPEDNLETLRLVEAAYAA